MTAARWIDPGDPEFGAATAALSVSTWQPHREPVAIVRAGTADEAVRATRAALERGHRIAVRSGGHSLSATHLADGAVTIDLRELNRIEVDAASATAWVEPGVTVARAAQALDAAGMSFPIGHAPTVGLGGYLLAGGNGWCTPQWGHGCERVLAAEVVLTNGDRRVVDRERDPDLWRAVRGAGPLFPGVVLRFQVQLVRGAATVRRALATVAATEAAQLGARLDDLLDDLGSSVETTVFWHPATRTRSMPEALVTLTAFDPHADPAAALARHALPLTGRTEGPLAEVVAALPRHEGDALASDHVWTGASYATLLPRLPQRGDILTECSSILLTTGSRRADGRLPDDAFYVPAGTMSVSPYAHWDPHAQPWQPQVDWTRQVTAGLGDLTTGHYVGEADLRNGPDAVVRCFPGEVRTALGEVLTQHDPDERMAWTAEARRQLTPPTGGPEG